MKKALISLVILISITLTGCVSQAEFDALEERVSRLEQNSGNNDQKQIETTSAIVLESTNIDSSIEVIASENQYQIYSLEGKTGEEIYSQFELLSKTISKGGKLDNCFEVEPCKTESEEQYDTDYYYFWGNTWGQYPETVQRPDKDECAALTNYITHVRIYYHYEMDGSLISANLQVYLVLNNYEAASYLFERVYENYCQNSAGNDDRRVSIDKYDTYWITTYSDVYGYETSMNKERDNYSLILSIPVYPA